MPKGGKRDASPVKDINKPFQQTWQDVDVQGEELNQAENIYFAKRYLAHTYLSTKVDTEQLFEVFGKDANVESFVQKAVRKAYKVIDAQADCKINGMSEEHSVGLSHVDEAQEALPICVPPFGVTVHYTNPI